MPGNITHRTNNSIRTNTDARPRATLGHGIAVSRRPRKRSAGATGGGVRMRAETPPASDAFERRILRRVRNIVQSAQNKIIAKIEEKEQLDFQRLEAAKVGWSKFILKRCIDTFVTLVLRNLPLILSMVLSIEIASGAAAGPLGLGISMGAIGLVALLVLGWQAYQAFLEYRALKRAAAEAEAQATQPEAAHARAAQPEVPEAADTRPAPMPPPRRRMGLRGCCSDFAHFFWQRGIR